MLSHPVVSPKMPVVTIPCCYQITLIRVCSTKRCYRVLTLTLGDVVFMNASDSPDHDSNANFTGREPVPASKYPSASIIGTVISSMPVLGMGSFLHVTRILIYLPFHGCSRSSQSKYPTSSGTCHARHGFRYGFFSSHYKNSDKIILTISQLQSVLLVPASEQSSHLCPFQVWPLFFTLQEF
jgi:hypothetical protein